VRIAASTDGHDRGPCVGTRPEITTVPPLDTVEGDTEIRAAAAGAGAVSRSRPAMAPATTLTVRRLRWANGPGRNMASSSVAVTSVRCRHYRRPVVADPVLAEPSSLRTQRQARTGERTSLTNDILVERPVTAAA
jgi:hypothetical protein